MGMWCNNPQCRICFLSKTLVLVLLGVTITYLLVGA